MKKEVGKVKMFTKNNFIANALYCNAKGYFITMITTQQKVMYANNLKCLLIYGPGSIRSYHYIIKGHIITYIICDNMTFLGLNQRNIQDISNMLQSFLV